MSAERDATVLRGRVLTFDQDGPLYSEDGFIVCENGIIVSVGPSDGIPEGLPIIDHRPNLIMPGFVDAHVHYPQTQVIASYGAQLLDWLQTYTFVEEQKFADPAHSARIADFFLDELLRNGTTSAAVYCTVHPESVDAFFQASSERNTRMIAGKVLMDREAPAGLLDTPQQAYDDTMALIGRWHDKGRQIYGITPRFAVTSTEAQLEVAGTLLRNNQSCYLQTHLSENGAEIEMVAQQFPWAVDYTDVYDRFGLLSPNSLFGHCIHLSPREKSRLSETGSVAVFCPTSNLFIGSGLFDMSLMVEEPDPVRIALATDVGGGTSYSMLRTAAEAYKVLQLQNENLPAIEAFRQITKGNAEALGLGGLIGSIAPGIEADLVVLNSSATSAMAHRMETVQTLEEELFVLMTMGDDRSIAATYVAGKRYA